MKWLFTIIFAVAVLLAVIANVTMPKGEHDDVVCTLVWATDENPARAEQMELFRMWYLDKYHEKIDIRIDPLNYDFSKIVVQSLSGAGPDLFDYFGCQALERFISSGIILDVTDEANAHGFNKELVWEGVWASFVSNGRQYAFPDNVANYTLIYQKKLFHDAGIPYPKGDWTWDEFLEVAKKLSHPREGGMRQFALLAVSPMTLIYQNDAHMFTTEGTRCTFDSPQAIQALQFFEDMRTKYKVMPTAADLASQAAIGGWGGNEPNLFATGYFASVLAGRYWYIGFARDAQQAIAQGKPSPFDLGVAPVPYFKHQWGKAGARCTGISRTSKHVKYALRFQQYLASEPYNRQINRTFDALAPVKKYCTGPQGIADGAPPLPGLEGANDSIWVTAMKYAHDAEVSPFIPAYRVELLWTEMSQAFDSGDLTAEQMLRRFTSLVNEEIQRNVKRHPALHAQYEVSLEKERRQ